MCRRAIESAYTGLLTDPAVLPGLERAFQQRVLGRLEALADVPEQVRAILAAVAKFGVVDIESAGPTVFFAGGWQRLEDAYLSPDELFHRLGLGGDLQDFSPRPTLIAEIDTRLADPTVHSGWIVLEAEAGLGKTAVLAHLARTRHWAHHFAQRTNQDTTDRVLALRSLAAQLIPSCGLQQFLFQGGGLPDAAGRTDWFSRLLTAAARRRAAAGITDPLVVVVDGLDEAAPVDGGAESIPLGLPEHLPDGVFIVAARRVGEDAGFLLPAELPVDQGPGHRRGQPSRICGAGWTGSPGRSR